MAVDMTPEAIGRRLRIAGELMRTCLELGKARPAGIYPAAAGPSSPPPAPASAGDGKPKA
jgi:hypothetical protein